MMKTADASRPKADSEQRPRAAGIAHRELPVGVGSDVGIGIGIGFGFDMGGRVWDTLGAPTGNLVGILMRTPEDAAQSQ